MQGSSYSVRPAAVRTATQPQVGTQVDPDVKKLHDLFGYFHLVVNCAEHVLLYVLLTVLYHFSLRRKEIVEDEPRVGDIKDRWPALFHERQVKYSLFQMSSVWRLSRSSKICYRSKAYICCHENSTSGSRT